jgi:hypothetical protein
MKKIIANKKAQSLGGLYGGILVVASIGILLALVMYILSSIGNSMQISNTIGTVVNETGGYVNQTGYTLVQSTLRDDFANPVITAVINATNNVTLLAGNYTLNGNSLVNASVVKWPNVKVSYTYTYSADTASSNATATMVDQFVDFLPWLGIILLVLAAGVVLFFVIRSFAGSDKGI